MNFLDCTLRDGGYYNRWDFTSDIVERVVTALSNAGVDIIEVGYKYPPSQTEYYGLTRYCNEDFLEFLHKKNPVQYAFMIDVKAFLDGQDVRYEDLNRYIKPASESPFTWVRLASYYSTVDSVPGFVEYFREKGYKTTFNLMGGSLLTEKQLLKSLEIADNAYVDVFYFADSFGSMYPKDIRQIMKFVKSNFNGKIGIHTHNSQGMAYANAIAAEEEGVDFIDGTITGIGRGAGNLATEQILLGHYGRGDKSFQPSKLLPIISDYFEPMKRRHMWGYSFNYMYSGLQNIHPSYCQKLTESMRFTPEEINNIIDSIPKNYRAKFDKKIWDKAINKQLKSELESTKQSNTKLFDIKSLHSKDVIILARGENAKAHIPDIIRLSNRLQAPIIECNMTGYLKPQDRRIMVILNKLKIQDWRVQSLEKNNIKLVFGMPLKTDEKTTSYHYPFKLGEFEIKKNLTIPDYDVGLYALALSMKAGVRRILLAGFDGFNDEELNRSREIFLKQIKENAIRDNVEISHITDTYYKVFPKKSLYII